MAAGGVDSLTNGSFALYLGIEVGMNRYVLPEARAVQAVLYEGLAAVYPGFSLLLKTGAAVDSHEGPYGTLRAGEEEHDKT